MSAALQEAEYRWPANATPNCWPTTVWERIGPEEAGMAAALLEESDMYINKHLPKLTSFLVVRRGLLLHERYYQGASASTLMDVRSVTKSFTGTLIGIALRDKMLDSVNQPLSEFFPEWFNGSLACCTDKQDLTVRHLLTMTTGAHWSTGQRLGEKYVRQLHRSADWLRFIMRLPIRAEQVGRFQYRSTDSHLLSCLISRLTGTPAAQYARQRLFDPLGIGVTEWPADPQGHSAGHVFLQISPRDMAKLGLLYLYRGDWQGTRIVPEEWVIEAISAQTEGMPTIGAYGYQLWNGTIGGHRVCYALGHGGQFIYVIPSLEMVVVLTADPKVNRWKQSRPLLERYVIPAIREL